VRWAALAALAAIAAVLLAACGGDDGEAATGPVAYDVVLVIGAAIADEGADPAGFPGEGTEFVERWVLDYPDDDSCVLHRNPAAPLGALEELELVRGEGDRYEGEATGVTPVPDPHEDEQPCAGTATERWTVTVELSRDEDVVVGSVFRVPEALVEGDCFGLDLTLGFSGTATTN
jgi:hypothetical protein